MAMSEGLGIQASPPRSGPNGDFEATTIDLATRKRVIASVMGAIRSLIWSLAYPRLIS